MRQIIVGHRGQNGIAWRFEAEGLGLLGSKREMVLCLRECRV